MLESFQAEPLGLLFISCRRAGVPVSRHAGWFINGVR